MAKDVELEARLLYARAVGMAATVCFRQLVRVLLERDALKDVDMQDALGEALASVRLDKPANDEEAAIALMAARAIKQCFGLDAGD